PFHFRARRATRSSSRDATLNVSPRSVPQGANARKQVIMDLENQRASSNVEDRRGMGMVGGGLGVGGVVVALIAYFLGFDPAVVTQVAEQVSPQRDTRE